MDSDEVAEIKSRRCAPDKSRNDVWFDDFMHDIIAAPLAAIVTNQKQLFLAFGSFDPRRVHGSRSAYILVNHFITKTVRIKDL